MTTTPVFKAIAAVERFRAAGLPEYAVYAAALVGHLVTEQSRTSMTPEMIKEYDAAVDEYKAHPGECANALRRAAKQA